MLILKYGKGRVPKQKGSREQPAKSASRQITVVRTFIRKLYNYVELFLFANKFVINSRLNDPASKLMAHGSRIDQLLFAVQYQHCDNSARQTGWFNIKFGCLVNQLGGPFEVCIFDTSAAVARAAIWRRADIVSA